MTFRPGTSDLWIGDVGWGAWEEINRHSNPSSGVLNYGWPCYEGGGRQSGYDPTNLNVCETLYGQSGAVTAPYFTYSHGSTLAGCAPNSNSISGLTFYTGTTYPSQYRNALFFTDYSRGCIWVMHPGGNGLPNPSNVSLFASAIKPVALQTGPSGDVFAVDHLGGTIVRFSFTSSNQPPTAVIQAVPTSGPVPLTVNFNGSGSSDPDGDPLTYSWDLNGDGQFGDSTSPTPSFVYTVAGSYLVGLRVDDGRGGTNTTTVTITASGPGGDGFVSLPGSAGNYVSAPDAARLDVTGDLDVRADVALNDWSTNSGKFIAKLGDAYEFMLNGTSKGLRVAWFETAGALRIRNSNAALPVSNGQRIQVRAALDVDNGAGGHTVTFYYRTNTTLSLSDHTGWTQLGSAVTISGLSSVRAGNSQIALGAHADGSKEFWAGSYYQAAIFNGIAGTPAANLDFRTTSQLISNPPNYTQWRDPAGNTWTIRGTATYQPG
jgi:hypothetical protein